MSGLTKIDRGVPRKFHNFTSADTPSGNLTTTERQDSEGNEPVAALLTVDTNPIRFRVDGGDPDQSTSSGHRLGTGELHWLLSLEEIRNFDFVSMNNGAGSEVHLTLYY